MNWQFIAHSGQSQYVRWYPMNLRIFSSLISISTLVADRFTGSCDNNRVASTIPDDRQMASVQDEPSSLVLADKLTDWLVNFQRSALLPFLLHRKILMRGVMVGGLRAVGAIYLWGAER